jgi:DNA-binding MarR family transcriptional regulator
MTADHSPPPAADLPYADLTAPAVLLFGDTEARREALAAMVAQAGGRLVASAPVEAAPARIARQAAMGGVILDLSEDGGAALDTLLIQLEAAAQSGRYPSLVLATPDLIDIAAARLPGQGVTLLVAPERAEMTRAIEAMLEPRVAMVADSAGEANSRRLAELSEEVGRIARTLASLSAAGVSAAGADAAQRPEESSAPARPVPSDSAMVRAILRLRRLRDQHFEPALFADPAWDILLDLTAAGIERRQVAVSSLCIAAAVPPTTALRWITQMTEQAILIRKPDPVDGRRVFIALSDAAAAAMTAYLAAARLVMAPAG